MNLKKYYKIQENGSDWTRYNLARQSLVKESIIWMIQSMFQDPIKLLDIGCGDGWGTQFIKEKLPNTKVVGVDVCEPKLKIARLSGVDAKFMDMHNIEGEWDTIFCSHTLEHSYDIDKALNSILDHLLPGGKLYLIVPIEPNVKGKVDGAHTQVIHNDDFVINIIKKRKDVVIEFTGHNQREVLELFLIIRKI
jgi:ubiquinone/menaquinone biosynthesis C-methylase UbiE